MIQISRISNSEFNLRSRDQAVIDELMCSIKQNGLLQPIMVSRRDERFEVIFGNHRLEACRRLGWKEIPAIVRQTTAEDMFILQIVENIQRNNFINPIEEARGYKFLIGKGMTIQEIAVRIGKSYQYVWSKIRLIDKLHPQVIDGLARRTFRRLNTSHAEQLSMLKDTKRQIELARVVEDRNLTVSQLERIIYSDLSNSSETEESSAFLTKCRKNQNYFVDGDRIGFVTQQTFNILIDNLGKKARSIGRVAGRSRRLSMLEKANTTIAKTDWILSYFNEITGWGKLTLEGEKLVITDPIVRSLPFLTGYLEGLFGVKLKPATFVSSSRATFTLELGDSPHGELAEGRSPDPGLETTFERR